MSEIDRVREELSSKPWWEDPFKALTAIARLIGADENGARELLIRALENRFRLPSDYQCVLDDLSMGVGLYPYVEDATNLSLAGALAHAAHRAEGELAEIVLHRSQAVVFQHLLAGKSVILSAPTSYGKSLLIDALIAARNFDNVTLLVPTIALMEETRRRMVRFDDRYNVVTNKDQGIGDRNIFVLTQERYLSLRDEMPPSEFFAIDEFYKLSLEEDAGRAALLNQAMIRLVADGGQFYLLGPSIQQIPAEVVRQLNCLFLVEDFHTVAVETHYLPKKPSREASLAKILPTVKGQTLVYCQSPPSARRLCRSLLEESVFPELGDPELIAASDWTAEHFHEDWLVSRALRFGIGVHHGRIPRALNRFMVRTFEEGKLQVLICTSTLIEGVNTSARNVVIFDSKLSRKRLDLFTFNNIKGRSGRMFKHFVGQVFLFDHPPEDELPFVDIPAFHPSETTPTSILLQLPIERLPPEAVKRVHEILAQTALPLAVLHAHPGIEPEILLETAESLLSISRRKLLLLSWSGVPRYEELKASSEFIWNQLKGAAAARSSGLKSSRMMTLWIWRLQQAHSVGRFRRSQILDQMRYKNDADDAVEEVLAFLRNWAAFNYPKYLMALNDVARVVLRHRGLPECDYSFFSTSIEHLFQPSSFGTLEEYGLLPEISQRLLRAKVFDKTDSLSSILSRLRRGSLRDYGRGVFERGVLEDFQEGIGRRRRRNG